MSEKKPAEKSKGPELEQALLESVVVGIFKMFKWLFSLRKGGKPARNGAQASKYAELRALGSSWPTVQQHLSQPGTYALAVSEADKILDAALQIKGSPGSSMGERLKNVETIFEHDLYQRLWDAHKLRNSLAHEVGVQVTEIQARQAVQSFQEALRQLGVL